MRPCRMGTSFRRRGAWRTLAAARRRSARASPIHIEIGSRLLATGPYCHCSRCSRGEAGRLPSWAGSLFDDEARPAPNGRLAGRSPPSLDKKMNPTFAVGDTRAAPPRLARGGLDVTGRSNFSSRTKGEVPGSGTLARSLADSVLAHAGRPAVGAEEPAFNKVLT